MIVGNARVLAQHQTWNQLIHHFKSLNAIVDGPGNGGPNAVTKMVQVSLNLKAKKEKPAKPLPLVDMTEYVDESDVFRSGFIFEHLFGGFFWTLS